jgi:hypothetical protein
VFAQTKTEGFRAVPAPFEAFNDAHLRMRKKQRRTVTNKRQNAPFALLCERTSAKKLSSVKEIP